jgi:hypothetical protein
MGRTSTAEPAFEEDEIMDIFEMRAELILSSAGVGNVSGAYSANRRKKAA